MGTIIAFPTRPNHIESPSSPHLDRLAAAPAYRALASPSKSQGFAQPPDPRGFTPPPERRGSVPTPEMRGLAQPPEMWEFASTRNAPSVSRAASRPSKAVFLRRRLLVLAVMISIGLLVYSIGFTRSAPVAEPLESVEAVIVVVEPGDTLWSIASRINPGADPRRIVDALEPIAGGESLQPQQRLVIPSNLLH